MRTNSARSPALSRVAIQRGDLDAASASARKRALGARHRHHHRLGQQLLRNRRTGDDPGALVQRDPRHTAGTTALRTHLGGLEPQQLGVRGHHCQEVRVRRGAREDHPVALGQGDDLPALGVPRLITGLDPLDDAVSRGQDDRRVVGRSHRNQTHHLLLRLDVHQLANLSRAGQPRGSLGAWHLRGGDDVEQYQPAGVGDRADPSTRRGGHLGGQCVVGLAPAGAGHRLGAGNTRHQPGGRQDHSARVVGDSERYRGGARHERHRLSGGAGTLLTST